jgi:hypothetical protein
LRTIDRAAHKPGLFQQPPPIRSAARLAAKRIEPAACSPSLSCLWTFDTECLDHGRKNKSGDSFHRFCVALRDERLIHVKVKRNRRLLTFGHFQA